MRSTAALGSVVLLAATVLTPSQALGQSPPASRAPRHVFEVWLGPTVVSSGFDGTITADYPLSLLYGSGSGRATQQLTLSTPRHFGAEGGIGVFPIKHVGFQVRLHYVTADFSGTSGPFRVTLDYTSTQPPDYVPTQHHLDSSRDWPAPTGAATLLTVSFEGAVRWEAGTRFSGTASGGLTYFRAKGHADSLAYREYWLWGNSTLASMTYAASVSYGTVSARGFDVGGGMAARVGGPVAVLVDVRYFHASRLTPEIRVSGFADYSAPPGHLSIYGVNPRMAPIKASFDPSFARIFLGVRVRS